MKLVPYTKEPLIAKIGQRVALHGIYLSLLAVGIIALTVLPWGWLDIPGWILILGTLTSLGGVVRGKYRLEYASLPFIIGACLVLAVLLHTISSGLSIALLVGTSAYLINRWIILSLVAKVLREDAKEA